MHPSGITAKLGDVDAARQPRAAMQLFWRTSGVLWRFEKLDTARILNFGGG